MYYQVSKEFFDKLPNACFGAVAVRGLDNTHEIPELEQMLAENVAACETYFAGKKPKETEDILPLLKLISTVESLLKPYFMLLSPLAQTPTISLPFTTCAGGVVVEAEVLSCFLT